MAKIWAEFQWAVTMLQRGRLLPLTLMATDQQGATLSTASSNTFQDQLLAILKEQTHQTRTINEHLVRQSEALGILARSIGVLETHATVGTPSV